MAYSFCKLIIYENGTKAGLRSESELNQIIWTKKQNADKNKNMFKTVTANN